MVFIDHDVKYSGLTRELKIGKVLQLMKDAKVDALFVGMLEEISWLLNVKATGQHEFDPLFNSALLIIAKEEPKLHLFVQDNCLAKSEAFFAQPNLEELTVLPHSSVGTKLKSLIDESTSVGIDAISCSDLVSQSIQV